MLYFFHPMSSPENPPPIHRILVVDDSPAIHEDFRKVLAGADANATADRLAAELFGEATRPAPEDCYEVDAAAQGEEARGMVWNAVGAGRPYAVAFVDMRMPPGWNGVQTVTHLREVDPALQFVICTAHSDYAWSEIRQALGPTDNLVILKKPFDKIEVLQLAHALSRKWMLAREVAHQIAGLDAAVELRTAELREANARLQLEMAARARVETALLQSQKMEAIGQLAAGIAHDFNNILTVVRGHTGMMLERTDLDADTSHSLQEVAQAAGRATTLAGQLLTLSRKQRLNPRAFDVNETIEQLHSLLSRVLGETISLRIDCAPDLPPLFADEPQIEQVLINLAVNARDAMPQGGRLIIGTRLVRFRAAQLASQPDAAPGDFIAITVADTGFGMTPEVLQHLFEPFFTTKAVGKGTGLGLATAYGIVKQHGGWIEVDSERGGGSVFRIFLPRGDAAEVAEHPPQPRLSPALRGNESVLVVEDEPTVRAVVRSILTQSGYRVVESESGEAALALWQTRESEFDLLLTDMVMPGNLNGQALAEQLRGERPNLRILLTTGYVNQTLDEARLAAFGMELLHKPYTAEELLVSVRRCLDRLPLPAGS